ncbi:MAG: alpha/beta fold hydrolase [Patescibacteria group bacterium]|nr:alpha/beta fold hydrolase [Patescibacteria group bacterium]MDE2438621.1 alpha/beta fold hydrolase [Patescibacteria group bacterium]
MKMTGIIAGICFLLSFGFAHAARTTFFTGPHPAQSLVWGYGSHTTADRVAEEYTPSSDEEICEVDHALYRSLNASGEVILSVYEGGTEPESGTLIATSSLSSDAVPVSTVSHNTVFTLDSCMNLVAHTSYWFVMTRTRLQYGAGFYSLYGAHGDEASSSYWEFDTFGPYGWQKHADRDWSLELKGSAPLKEPVIIVPGIAGSELYNGDDLIWADLTQMLFSASDQFMTDNLALDSQGKSLKSIEAKDVIESILNVPLLSVNIFKNLHDDLVTNNYTLGQDLFLFPYDWRLNLDVTEDALAEKINDVLTQTGADKVTIIAHSMGGLLVKDYIRHHGGAEIDKLIFVGTPHLGAPEAGRIMLYGDTMGIPWLNPARVQEITAYSPATYELLPSSAYFEYSPGYLLTASSSTFLDNAASRDALLARGAHEPIMGLADMFWNENLENLDFSGIDTYNIAGCGTGTESAYAIKSDNALGNIDYTSGDGTVPLVSADAIAIPSDHKWYVKNVKHAELPSAIDVRSVIAQILLDGSVTPTGNITVSATDCGIQGKEISWHSPVEIHVYDTEGRHTGPTGNNAIEYGIPGVEYTVAGHDKFVFLPSGGESYHLVMKGLDSGSFDMKVAQNVNGAVGETAVFNDVPITASSTGTMDITDTSTDDTLQVDSGEGESPSMILASSHLAAGEEGDVTPPTTSLEIEGARDNGAYQGPTTVSLTATDDNAGVAETYVARDGGDTEAYRGPLVLSDLGAHTLRYYSVDNAGNDETLQEIHFSIEASSHELRAQSITFDAIPDAELGTADIALVATSTSGLSLQFFSESTGTCTLASSSVHLVSAGTCTVRAEQSGSDSYRAASSSQSFAVLAVPVDSSSEEEPAMKEGAHGSGSIYLPVAAEQPAVVAAAVSAPLTHATSSTWDITGDGAIDIHDFNTLCINWGALGQGPADLNHDGVVDIFDFNALMAHWGM